MSRSKHQNGRLNGKRKGDWRNRCNRLGRHLRWHGRRLSKTDEPFDMQVRWPRNVMAQNTAADVGEWVLQTPNRWWLVVTLYCRDANGGEYDKAFEYDTGQQCTAEELAEWRIECIEAAKEHVNTHHLWLETVELGIH